MHILTKFDVPDPAALRMHRPTRRALLLQTKTVPSGWYSVKEVVNFAKKNPLQADLYLALAGQSRDPDEKTVLIDRAIDAGTLFLAAVLGVSHRKRNPPLRGQHAQPLLRAMAARVYHLAACDDPEGSFEAALALLKKDRTDVYLVRYHALSLACSLRRWGQVQNIICHDRFLPNSNSFSRYIEVLQMLAGNEKKSDGCDMFQCTKLRTALTRAMVCNPFVPHVLDNMIRDGQFDPSGPFEESSFEEALAISLCMKDAFKKTEGSVVSMMKAATEIIQDANNAAKTDGSFG